MTKTTASTARLLEPLTYKSMIEITKELEKVLADAPTDWFLVSPQGKVWKGSAVDLLAVLLPYHPLLRNPFGEQVR